MNSRIRISVSRANAIWVIVLGLIFFTDALRGQAENVPTNHGVYVFLKRLELKGIIDRYHDALVPLSRREIAEFLRTAYEKQDRLTRAEREFLDGYLIEFEYDLYRTLGHAHSLVGSHEPTFGLTLFAFLSDKQKYLYAYADTNVTFFVDGLLKLDRRRSTGDDIRGENTTFLEGGGRLRGTVYGRLGYYIQATNAQFWGSRRVLFRDNQINQSYALGTTNSQNFDFAEGYVRYDGNIVAAQVGRERLLWGFGYGDKMIATDNVRVYDFVRVDAAYKSFKYNFVHAWLLGRRSLHVFTLPSDTSFQFYEPLNADKYFAAHRFGFSFPRLFDIGFQEIAIYSNRSPDLAYLNPITLIESAQRSRDERDNVYWAFDIKTNFMRGMQFHGTLLFDDINFPKMGTGAWENRFGYQLGAMTVDPPGMNNVALFGEYTRIEPYVFAHNRSRDSDYSSGGRLLGHPIGPNAESWMFGLQYLFGGNLYARARYKIQREGNNIYDPQTGFLIKNVGGDFRQGHRTGIDSDFKEFLGGNRVKTQRLDLFVWYELVNQVALEFRYEFEDRREGLTDVKTRDHDFGVALRVDF